MFPAHAHLKNMKEDKSSSRGRTHLLRGGGCKDVEWLGRFVNKGANDSANDYLKNIKVNKFRSGDRNQLLRRRGCQGDRWRRRYFHACANVSNTCSPEEYEGATLIFSYIL